MQHEKQICEDERFQEFERKNNLSIDGLTSAERIRRMLSGNSSNTFDIVKHLFFQKCSKSLKILVLHDLNHTQLV